MKPEGARYRATMQVKGLSPEITVISEVSIPSVDSITKADAVHLAAGSSLITAMRGYETPTGSETVEGYKRDRLGTREGLQGMYSLKSRMTELVKPGLAPGQGSVL